MNPNAKALALLGTAVALTATLACPIQRSPVPREYMGFRAQLQDAVTDTARVEMEGLTRMQDRLEIQLPDLAAILTVDSLLTALDADPELAPLSGAIATTVRIQLEAKGVDGGVRKAYRNPDGQRQAVDAIVIGLGRALYRSQKPFFGPAFWYKSDQYVVGRPQQSISPQSWQPPARLMSATFKNNALKKVSLLFT